MGAVAIDDGFVIALPYGPNTDWLKNVLASGSATIVNEGNTYDVDRPEVVPMAEAGRYFSPRIGAPMACSGSTSAFGFDGSGRGSPSRPILRSYGTMTARPFQRSRGERAVGVAGCVEAEALDVGLDEAPTSQVEHLAQLGKRPPVGRGQGNLVGQGEEAEAERAAADANHGHVGERDG